MNTATTVPQWKQNVQDRTIRTSKKQNGDQSGQSCSRHDGDEKCLQKTQNTKLDRSANHHLHKNDQGKLTHYY